MFQYESDESDATLSEDVVKTEGAPGVAPAAMRLSALGEVLGDAYAELTTIRKKGSFDLRYHLMMNGVSCPTILRAVLVNENDGEKIIVGLRRISQQSGS